MGITELSAGDYEEALRNMEALEAADPENYRLRELPYHKGRVLYHLNRFNEAIILFGIYTGSLVLEPGRELSGADASRKAAALYWTGECLFSMGQLDRAAEIFRHITETYPGSIKYEASLYRLEVINQKKVEVELLALLRWSHEESLRNMEEFRRREASYDQALGVYQRRIADMLRDTRLEELESSNTRYREQLGLAEERIRFLENSLREASSDLESVRSSASAERLQSQRESAREIESRILGTEGNSGRGGR
jgi:tetratricopeptide (TPR) repeat protein